MKAARICLAVVALLGAPGLAAAQSGPLIPLHTNFTYWDHHWIQWLPTHPRYEAIEASVASAPGDPENRYIRVWLTERAAPKRQAYYFSDAAMARQQPGESRYRPIAAAFAAAEPRPADLSLGFEDGDGRRVQWRMRFAPQQPLSDAFSGLKPQGGHAADAVFLLWWIGPNATTIESEVSIGSETFGIAPADLASRGHPYGAAYSRGVYGGVLIYGSAQVRRDGALLRSDWAGGRAFATSAAGLRSAPFGFANAGRIELLANGGSLTTYRHWFGRRHMSVAFDPPLPAMFAGYSGTYAISFDDRLALRGTLSGHGTALRWTPDEPAWARSAPLRTEFVERGDSGYELRVTRALD